MEVVETKKRTLFKTISWRVVAVMNSWTVLSLGLVGSNFWNAIIMNVSGFIFFYFFERIWSKIKYGRYTK
jgi:uncharacterized membrane protein